MFEKTPKTISGHHLRHNKKNKILIRKIITLMTLQINKVIKIVAEWMLTHNLKIMKISMSKTKNIYNPIMKNPV